MRKQAPRHMAPPPRGRRTRGVAAGLVGTVVVGLGVYGLSQSTAATGAPVVEMTTQPTAVATATAAAATSTQAATSAVPSSAAPTTPAATATVTTDAEVTEELEARQRALVASSKKVTKQAERLATVFVMPAEGKIGSQWGMRLHPILKVWKMHEGGDIGAACGSPIKSVLSGTVTEATFGSASGYHVRVDHGDVNGKHIETDSLHMTNYVVEVGDKVQRGQVIGYVGTTGRSTECHLHFSLYVDGSNSDPAPYLDNAEK